MDYKKLTKWPTNMYIWGVFSIVFGGIAVFWIQSYTDKQYELIKKTSVLHDKIIWVNFDHADYITLKSGRKIVIANMYNDKNSSFCELAAPYDSLVKEANNDTLNLIKGDKRYFYIVKKCELEDDYK
jgi:hypothetical protein